MEFENHFSSYSHDEENTMGKKRTIFFCKYFKTFFFYWKKKNPSNINSQEKNGHHYQEETAVSSLKSLKWLYLSQTESIFFNFANHELLNSTQWGRLILKKKKSKAITFKFCSFCRNCYGKIFFLTFKKLLYQHL